LNTQSAATAKTDGAASATATISGTGDSKNSSGSRKAGEKLRVCLLLVYLQGCALELCALVTG